MNLRTLTRNGCESAPTFNYKLDRQDKNGVVPGGAHSVSFDEQDARCSSYQLVLELTDN